MLKRYSDFLNESLELLLESNIVYSNNFKTVMNKINHPLAKAILEIENKDLPVRNNYFDINPSENDKLEFIPDRKAQDILNDKKEYVNFIGDNGGWLKHKETNQTIFSKLGYTYEEGVEPYSPGSDEVGEVIDKVKSEISGKTYAWVKFENGQGVYNVDKLRTTTNKLNSVWKKGRQNIFVGRGIRALLTTAGIQFTDKDLEEFVNLYKSTVDKMNNRYQYFDIVKGDDIGYWYNYNNYFERKGSIGSSCMRDVDVEYFDIYMSNPDVCQLVILKSDEDDTKIIGRALLWTLNTGRKFLDRIYTCNESDVNLFREYAKDNGWYYKQYNGSSDSAMVYDNGEAINLGKLTVNIYKGEYEKYPYLDTLKYLDIRKGTLSTEKLYGNYLLEDTDGHYIYCPECDNTGKVCCTDCDGDGTVGCWSCDGNGDKECSNCDGDGKVSVDGELVDCDECDGSGKVDCSRCDGDGSYRCNTCYGDGEYDCPDCN